MSETATPERLLKVAQAANEQNSWAVEGVAFTRTTRDGVVLFRHRDQDGLYLNFGTAAFHHISEGDDVLFEWGHYDMSAAQGADDFAERIKRGY